MTESKSSPFKATGNKVANARFPSATHTDSSMLGSWGVVYHSAQATSGEGKLA